MTMDTTRLVTIEFSAYWLGVLCYVAAALFFAYGNFFHAGNKLKRAVHLVAAGLIPHAAAIAIHWQRSGHGPYLGSFESVSATIWCAEAFFVLMAALRPGLRPIGVVIAPMGFLLLAAGIMLDPAIHFLPPSFQTIWLVIHILFNKLALAAILMALGCAIFYLRTENRAPAPDSRLPPPETLDRLSYQFCGLCFVCWTMTIAAGSIWANKSWGRYWAWDPIELWSFVTWLLFGLYLHLRRFHGLRGRAAARLLIACFALVIFTLFASPFLSATIHREYLLM